MRCIGDRRHDVFDHTSEPRAVPDGACCHGLTNTQRRHATFPQR
jgi:hypothetical protein